MTILFPPHQLYRGFQNLIVYYAMTLYCSLLTVFIYLNFVPYLVVLASTTVLFLHATETKSCVQAVLYTQADRFTCTPWTPERGTAARALCKVCARVARSTPIQPRPPPHYFFSRSLVF